MPTRTQNLLHVLAVTASADSSVSSRKGLDERIRKQLTLRLWSDKLIARDSFEGQFTDVCRKWLKVDQPETRFDAVLKQSLQITSQDQIEGLPTFQKKALLDLQYSVCEDRSVTGMSEAQVALRAFLTKTEAQRLQTSPAWMEPKALRERSVLSQIPAADDSGMNLSLFNTIMHDVPSTDTPGLISYLNRFLKKRRIEPLTQAGERNLDLERIIEEGRKSPEALQAAHRRLSTLSEMEAKSLAGLKPNEKRLFFCTLPARLPKVDIGLHKLEILTKLHSLLNDRKKIEEIAKQITDTILKPLDICSLFAESDADLLRKVIQDGFLQTFTPALTRSLWKERSLPVKILLAPIELGRVITKETLEYIGRGLSKEFLPDFTHFLNNERIQKYKQAALQKKLQETLRKDLQGFLETRLELVQQLPQNALAQMASQLPAFIPNLISSMGYGEFGSAEVVLAFEVQRQENEQFTLSIYSSGSAALLHPSIQTSKGNLYQIPLVYKDLTAEQLDNYFLLRLFSYRSLTEWDKEIFYSEQDIHEGLLGSLKKDPVLFDQKEHPEKFSSDCAQMSGIWGTIMLYVRDQLQFKTPLDEQFFHFELRRKALLDFWQVHNRQFSAHKNALQSAIDKLLKEGLVLCEAGKLSLEELKALYATTWEMLEQCKTEEVPVVQAVHKSLVLPPGLSDSLKSFLVSTQTTHGINLIKDLLVGAIGEQVREPFELFVKDFMPPPAAPRPPLEHLKDYANSFLHPLRNPSWRSVAALSMQVVTFILMPNLSIKFVVILVAKRAFGELSGYLMPEYTRRFNAFKNQMLAFAAAKIMLPKEHLKQFQLLVMEWKGFISQTATFELPPYPQAATPLTLRRVQKIAQTESGDLAQRVLYGPVIRERAEEVHAKNVSALMKGWVEEVEKYVNPEGEMTNFRKIRIGFDCVEFLVEKMKSVPVPLPGNQSDCWSEVQEVRECLEYVGKISYYLYTFGSRNETLSLEKYRQLLVAVYHTYAITEKLGKRCEEAHLKEFDCNPWALAYIIHLPLFQLGDYRSHKKLRKLLHYWGIDQNRKYNHESIVFLARNSLFFTTSLSQLYVDDHNKKPLQTQVGVGFHSCGYGAEHAYLKKIRNTPLMVRKLAAFGITHLTEEVEVVKLLYIDPTVEQVPNFSNLPAEQQADLRSLFSENGLNPRCGLLPRAFSILRFVNTFANQLAIHSRCIPSILKLQIKDFNDQGMTPLVYNSPLVKITESALSLARRFISPQRRTAIVEGAKEIRGYFFDTHTVVRKGTSNAALEDEFRSFTASHWVSRHRSLHTSSLGSEFIFTVIHSHLQALPRSQNGILNDPSKFDRRIKKRSSFDFLKGLASDKEFTCKTVLSSLTAEERKLFEMIWLDPSQRASRTLSFFSMIMGRLSSSELRLLLDLLLFHDDTLYQQMERYPEFCQTVGDFFHKLLEVFTWRDKNARCGIIFMGIFARAQAEGVYPQSGKYFPDFRSMILNEFPIGRSLGLEGELLALPYLFIRPENASEQTKREAVHDLCMTNTIGCEDSLRMHREAFGIWRAEIQRLLDSDEAFKNSVLNEIALRQDNSLTEMASRTWRGEYPLYKSGHLTLKFEDGPTLTTKVELIKDAIKKQQVVIFGEHSYTVMTEGAGEFSFAGKYNVHVIEQGGKTLLRFSQIYNNKTYDLVSLPKIDFLPKGPHVTYWLGRTNMGGYSELLVLDRGEEKTRYSVRKKEGSTAASWRVCEVDIVPLQHSYRDEICEEVDLSKVNHGLGFLTWFQPLSTIRLLRASKSPHQAKKVHFTKLNLSFYIERADGELQAFSDDDVAPGFYIVKDQRERPPILNSHTHVLMLTNAKQKYRANDKPEYRAIIPSDSLSPMLIMGLLKRQLQFQTSHMGDHFINQYLAKLLEVNHEHAPYYLYSFDAKGRPFSDDPEALFYLLCHHLTQASHPDGKILVRHYLRLFEAACRHVTLPPFVKNYCQVLEVIGVLLGDEELRQLGMRLALAREENVFFHTSKQEPQKASELLISFLILQWNLYETLVKKPSKVHFKIDEYQELFLLKAMVNKAKAVLREHAKWSLSTQAILSDFGNEFGSFALTVIVEALMIHPQLMARYEHLCRKYSPRETSSLNAKTLLRNFIYGNPSTSTANAQLQGNLQRGNLKMGLAKALTKKNDRLFFSPTFLSSDEFIKNLKFPVAWDEIPTDLRFITDKDLSLYFLYYYRLAFGALPNPLRSFAKDWPRILHFLQAKHRSSAAEHILEYLAVVNARPHEFPHPSKIEEALVRSRRCREVYDKEKEALKDLEEAQRKERLEKLKIELNVSYSHLEYLMSMINSVGRGYALFQPKHMGVLAKLFQEYGQPMATTVATTSVASYIGSLVGATGLPLLYPAVQMGRSALKMYEDWQEAEAALEEERGLVHAQGMTPDGPLPVEWHTLLTQEDAQINTFLMHAYRATFLEIPLPDAPQERVSPLVPSRQDRLCDIYFTRLNQCLSELYHRPRPQATDLQAQGLEHLYALQQFLRQASVLFAEFLKQDSTEIVDWATTPSFQDLTDRQMLTDLISTPDKHKKSPLTPARKDEIFEEFVTALVQEQDKEILQNCSLQPHQVAELKLRLYRYLIKARGLHRLLRTQDNLQKVFDGNLDIRHPETIALLKLVQFDMTRAPSYSFAHRSRRFITGNLIFEYRELKMLWEKQVALGELLAFSPHQRTVSHQTTGGGKTTGISTTAHLCSNGHYAMHIVLPSSLIAEQSQQIMSISRNVFGHAIHRFKFTRHTYFPASHRQAFLWQLSRSRHQHHHLLSDKQSIQALELRLIEEMDVYFCKPKGNLKGKRSISLLMDILEEFQHHTRYFADEGPVIFRNNEELNHPLGKEQTVADNFVRTIAEFCLMLVKIPEVSKILGIRQNRQYDVDLNDYHRNIKTLIAKEYSRSKNLNIREDQRKEFVAYLRGDLKDMPSFIDKHPQSLEICLMVGLLGTLFPGSLKKKVKVDYGRSKLGRGKFARLFKANETPSETATIQSPYEAQLKTFLMILHERIENNDELILLLKSLRQSARSEMNNKPKNQTRAVRLFGKWTQDRFSHLDLFDLCDLPASSPILDELLPVINESDAAVLSYAMLHISPQIKFFLENSCSTSYDFASMPNSFLSATGTPNRDRIFPHRTVVLWDRPAMGAAVDFICREHDKRVSIVEIESVRPAQVLQEILHKHFHAGSKLSALIDQGAFLAGLSNDTVAETMMQFVLAPRPDNNGTNRPDIDGINYFNSDQKLVVLVRGAKKAIPFELCTLPLNRRLTYFPQYQAFGADVQQPLGGGAMVTTSYEDDFEGNAQAMGRMRGRDTLLQFIVFAIMALARKKISGDLLPTPKRLVEHLNENESRSQGEQNFPAALNQTSSIVRRAAMRNMFLARKKSFERAGEVFVEFRHLFISKQILCPKALFGQPTIEIAPEDPLSTYKRGEFACIDVSSSFTDTDKDLIWAQVQQVGVDTPFPKTVRVPANYQNVRERSFATLGRSQEVEQSVEQEQAQERAQEIQNEYDQELQVTVTEPLDDLRLRETLAKWPEFPYCTDRSWMKPSSILKQSNHELIELYTVQDTLKNSSNPALQAIAQGFPTTLWWTNNFLGVLDKYGVLAGPYEKAKRPVQELLITFRKNEHGEFRISSGALHNDDTLFWQKKLQEDRTSTLPSRDPTLKFALFNLGTGAIVDTGRNALSNEELWGVPLFTQHFIRWKYLAGHLNLQRVFHSPSNTKEADKHRIAQFREWMEQNDFPTMSRTFTQVIFPERGIQSVEGSDLAFLFERPQHDSDLL